MCVLQKIHEKIDLLFGAFSEKLLKENKIDTWENMFNFMIAVGCFNNKTDDFNQI